MMHTLQWAHLGGQLVVCAGITGKYAHLEPHDFAWILDYVMVESLLYLIRNHIFDYKSVKCK